MKHFSIRAIRRQPDLSLITHLWNCCLCLFLIINLGTPARGQSVEPLPVERVAPGAYVAKGAVETGNQANAGHIANIGFIFGTKYVAVIDTGGSYQVGRRLLAAVQSITKLPIKYIINTHMHPDHVLGNAAFLGIDATFVGHVKLPAALAARADNYIAANKQLIGETAFAGTQVIPPTKFIATPTKLDLGDRMLQVIPVETAHTDNDLIIIDQKTNSAWLGDLVFAEHLPVIDGSLNGWLGVMTDLMQLKFDFVVMGHGNVANDWPQSARPQFDYLSNLRQEVRKSIADGRTIDAAMNEIEPPAASVWKLTGDFHRRNISAAFAELEWE